MVVVVVASMLVERVKVAVLASDNDEIVELLVGELV